MSNKINNNNNNKNKKKLLLIVEERKNVKRRTPEKNSRSKINNLNEWNQSISNMNDLTTLLNVTIAPKKLKKTILLKRIKEEAKDVIKTQAATVLDSDITINAYIVQSYY